MVNILQEQDIQKIKDITEEFFKKMTVEVNGIDAFTVSQNDSRHGLEVGVQKEGVQLQLQINDPQVLIGQYGQTLFELSRLLRIMLNKKLGKDFFISLDINDYKKRKNDYLKDLANDAANQVVSTGQKKSLSPMPSYERRMIHAHLADRTDVVTESQGDGELRHVVIIPK